MSHTFDDILLTGTVGVDIPKIDANFKTLQSNFSGATFPTSPVKGMTATRTDRGADLGSGNFAGIVYEYSGDAAHAENGWVEQLNENSAVVLEVEAARGTKATVKERMDIFSNDDGTLKDTVTAVVNEWQPIPAAVFTYISTNSFKTDNDTSDIYKATRRLKVNLAASTIYTDVVSSAYSIGNDETTVVTRSVILDNTLVNVDHGIISPYEGDDGGSFQGGGSYLTATPVVTISTTVNENSITAGTVAVESGATPTLATVLGTVSGLVKNTEVLWDFNYTAHDIAGVSNEADTITATATNAGQLISDSEVTNMTIVYVPIVSDAAKVNSNFTANEESSTNATVATASVTATSDNATYTENKTINGLLTVSSPTTTTVQVVEDVTGLTTLYILNAENTATYLGVTVTNITGSVGSQVITFGALASAPTDASDESDWVQEQMISVYTPPVITLDASTDATNVVTPTLVVNGDKTKLVSPSNVDGVEVAVGTVTPIDTGVSFGNVGAKMSLDVTGLITTRNADAAAYLNSNSYGDTTISSGDFYFEITKDTAFTATSCDIGIHTNNTYQAASFATDTGSVSYRDNGSILVDNVAVETGLATYVFTDIIGVRYVYATGTVTFTKGGTPVGTPVVITPSTTVYPATNSYDANQQTTIDFATVTHRPVGASLLGVTYQYAHGLGDTPTFATFDKTPIFSRCVEATANRTFTSVKTALVIDGTTTSTSLVTSTEVFEDTQAIIEGEELSLLAVTPSGDSDGANNVSTTDSVPTMTSASSGGFTITASAEADDARAGYRAFANDGNTSRWTSSTSGASVVVTMDTAKIINKMTMQCTDGGRGAEDFTISGSNDNSNFDLLDTRVGITDWSSVNTFTFINNKEYLYYKIDVTLTVDSGITLEVSEIELIENTTPALYTTDITSLGLATAPTVAYKKENEPTTWVSSTTTETVFTHATSGIAKDGDDVSLTIGGVDVLVTTSGIVESSSSYSLDSSEVTGNYDVVAQTATSYSISFSLDGTKLYVADFDVIYQYTLSTPFDVSSATYASKSKDISVDETFLKGTTFSSDGTLLFICGNTATINKYTLSTAWDISTASLTQTSSILTTYISDTQMYQIHVKGDGTKVYVIGGQTDTVYELDMTANNLSTLAYNSKSKLISSEDGSMEGITLSTDGTKMFLAGSTTDFVYLYTLSTPFDVSTATLTSSFDTQLAELAGIDIASDGTTLCVAMGSGQTIVSNISTALSQYTATYSTQSGASTDVGLPPRDKVSTKLSEAFSTDRYTWTSTLETEVGKVMQDSFAIPSSGGVVHTNLTTNLWRGA